MLFVIGSGSNATLVSGTPDDAERKQIEMILSLPGFENSEIKKVDGKWTIVEKAVEKTAV